MQSFKSYEKQLYPLYMIHMDSDTQAATKWLNIILLVLLLKEWNWFVFMQCTVEESFHKPGANTVAVVHKKLKKIDVLLCNEANDTAECVNNHLTHVYYQL